MQVEESSDADLWLVNTCTVKNPSQSAMNTLITKGNKTGKKLLVAGCVPQVRVRMASKMNNPKPYIFLHVPPSPPAAVSTAISSAKQSAQLHGTPHT